jgi:RNA polymerase sigma factor (sigma-70 family)
MGASRQGGWVLGFSPRRGHTPPAPMNSPVITVALVEDDPLIRESLAVLINGASGFACVAAFATAEDALACLPRLQPEVVLMDINLPRMSGIECVARLKTASPGTQIVMLTMYEDDDAVFDSLAAGASGYLLKRTPHLQILEAISDVHLGGSPMTGSIARRIVESVQRTQTEARQAARQAGESQAGLAQVSAREREVLTFLAQGYRYKEIAEVLGLKVETVRTHLRRIYEKLHVSSRTEAVVRFLGQPGGSPEA